MFAPLHSAVVIVSLSIAMPVFAQETVLTITGAVAQPEEGEAWVFDMATLRQLPSARIETTTIWTTDSQTFEGVPLVDLLAHVGASGSSIRAVALNDYAVSIPVTDAVAGGPILAYTQNGAEMSIRNKGPLWIIYPFDDNEIYKSEEYYSRSIWQLDRIEVITEE